MTTTDLFLSYSSVSPLHPLAQAAINEFTDAHASAGLTGIIPYLQSLPQLKVHAGKLLDVAAEDISAVPSTAAALNMLASDYPLRAGDQILVYTHEYPSNYYPWLLAARRAGAILEIIPDEHGKDVPSSFTLDAIRARITSKTRLLCLSHVQFTSGFAADLENLAALCRAHQIDFVVDATQSIGALPLYPRQYELAAVVTSGWKWLLGPLGIGLMYTAPNFREKLGFSHGGPDMMQQGIAYLDHRWTPHQDGRRFEYSTLPGAYLHALNALLEKVFLPQGIHQIQQHIQSYHQRVLSLLDQSLFEIPALRFTHPSSILSMIPKHRSSESLCAALCAEGLFVTARGGYLRIAPHFCTPLDTANQVAEALNRHAKVAA